MQFLLEPASNHLFADAYASFSKLFCPSRILHLTLCPRVLLWSLVMLSLAISMSAMSIALRSPKSAMSSLSKTTSSTIIKTTGASGEGGN